MSEEFDVVMELMTLREGMLEDDRPGPADVLREAIGEVRRLEADNAWLRVRIAELAAGRPKRSSDVRPTLRPDSKGRPSSPSSSVRPGAQGRPSGRPQDSRPPPRASELLLSQELKIATEGERQDPESDLRLNADAARTRANGRAQDEHEDSRPDEPQDGYRDEDAADVSLRALMAAAWDGAGGAHTSGSYKSRMTALMPQLRRLAAEQGKEPIQLWSEAVARFKADPEARRKRLGLPVLVAQFDRWTYDVESTPANGRRAVDGPRGEAYRIIDVPPRQP